MQLNGVTFDVHSNTLLGIGASTGEQIQRLRLASPFDLTGHSYPVERRFGLGDPRIDWLLDTFASELTVYYNLLSSSLLISTYNPGNGLPLEEFLQQAYEELKHEELKRDNNATNQFRD